MITERTLKQWRKDALLPILPRSNEISDLLSIIEELDKRIVRLTQELMDIHLTKAR